MPILQVTTQFAGQVDVKPQLVRVDCNDDLDTVMSENYLAGRDIPATAFVCVNYSGGQNIFTPVYDDGSITLALQSTGLVVETPTVAGNIPQFADTLGNEEDSGIAAASLATRSGATVVNNVATFNNTTGEVKDSATAIGSLQLKANIKGSVTVDAGGSASFSITTTGVTSSSSVTAVFNTQANPASILKVTPGTNLLNIVASADPGACSISWIALVAPQ